jgi:hypothetical protein
MACPSLGRDRVKRVALAGFVLGLAVINGAGVFSQPVATVADIDRRIGQIDSAIEEAAKRGRTNAALSAMETQRRSRAGLVEDSSSPY